MNTQLIHLFIKNSVYLAGKHLNKINLFPITISLTNRFFTKPFFLFFKKINTKNFGIMTSNLTKSLIYKTLSEIDSLLVTKDPSKTRTSYTPTAYTVQYLQPITILSFAFQKKTYDTLMSYIIFLLVHNYTAPQNSFNLFYSFIICPHNLTLYPFLNLFYFKLRQF